MSIKLRENEVIKVQTGIHPMFHKGALVWAVFLTIVAVLGQFGKEEGQASFGGAVFFSIMFGWIPFGVSYLKFLTTKYYVTTMRIYLSSGIISRSTKDIPLSKVNDIEFHQGFLDRMNKTGRLRILTGNDKGTLVKDLEKPELFQESITAQIGHSEKRAA